MENLIYILAPIVYFLFQGYQNFKKEQEKARKRNLGVPPQREITAEQEVQTEPLILKKTEAVELKPDYKITKKEERIKQRREEIVYEKTKAAEKDYYNPEISSVERAAIKRSEKKSKTPQTLSVTALEEEEDFDLRDAIIKEAILNRPYH